MGVGKNRHERPKVQFAEVIESSPISTDELFQHDLLGDGEVNIERNVNSIRFKVPQSDARSDENSLDDDEDFSVVSSDDVEPIRRSTQLSRKEQAESINLSAKNFTKLEVVSSKEVAKLLWWFHLFILFGIAFSAVFVVLANTVYLQLDTLLDVEVRYYTLPVSFDWVLSLGGISCFLYAICLAIVYTSRMKRIRRKDRTHEQVWVILLIVAAALYLNPYESMVRLMNIANYNLRQDPWYGAVSRMYDSLRDASFTVSTVFYVWATVHSYRIVNGRLGFYFYLPKVSLVVIYLLLKQFAFWRFNIYMSEMPIASMVAMLRLYAILDSWPLPGVLCVSAVTVFEMFLLIWIFRDIRITICFLKGKDYMKYRTKQIGIRFFLYHNLTFYLVFWLCYLLLLLGLPPGAQLASMKLFDVSYVEVQYVPLGLTILYLSYITVEAYMNLPADAIGLPGWLIPRAPDIDGLLQPITYRKREIAGQNVQSNCFVMDTHVTMFNFAWLVYYYGTPKMSKLSDTVANFNYRVERVVSSKNTDTRVLIIDGEDRIVVSFRGTNSGRNLRTDLTAFHVKVSRVLPTSTLKLHHTTGGDFGTVAHQLLSSRDGERAKIHLGFAQAYMSVAERVMDTISQLLEENPRPIFLTGHSLGGALATICAFDCVLNLDVGLNDLHVSTFGSPRVGNMAFRRIYDDAVPASWRISIAADIVSKLPKLHYRHVGKKVMLTTAGDLFIDPNSLELSMWSGNATSVVHHRKSSYLLAMQSWCNRHHHGLYKPPFWNWPYSKDDERRWPDAVSDIARTNVSREHRRNLLHQDAMIDALNVSKADNPSERALENWSRLSRRLLLNNNIHKV